LGLGIDYTPPPKALTLALSFVRFGRGNSALTPALSPRERGNAMGEGISSPGL